jgi:RNA polymerase sigma factor (sigma-70 family)
VEASSLTHATRRGLFARRSPVLKLEKDARLIALIRSGHEGAFEVLFERYQSRLLAFCSSMLKSRQDAEDVLQEVFVNAHSAILADERKINARPWLYRIARNRCLNHLRRPVPEGQDSMDIHPHMNGTSTAERVQKREELRQVLDDVGTLPETQRTALLLREIDQLSYEEIAVAMETTVPAVKSLLVRARITLAESSEARTLSCEEVRVSLAEAAEGLAKASGPVRIHVRNCEGCSGFRDQLRADRKALAAIVPIGPMAALLKIGFLGKLFGGGSAGGAGGSAAAAGGTVSAIGGGAAAGGGATAGGLGAIGGAIGTKAAAGMATAALLTAGAVEVSRVVPDAEPAAPAIERVKTATDTPHKSKDKDPGPARRVLAASAGTGGIAAPAKQATASADPVEPAVAEEPPAPEAVEGERPAAEMIVEGEPGDEFVEAPIAGVDGPGRIDPSTVEPVPTTPPAPAATPPAPIVTPPSATAPPPSVTPPTPVTPPAATPPVNDAAPPMTEAEPLAEPGDDA